MKATARHSMVLYLLASSLFLTACGSSNSSSPNPAAGNIPNLASKPSAQASPIKTERFAGNVIDANTLAPIEGAEILLHVQAEKSAPNTNAPGNSSGSGNTSQNAPIPTSTPFPAPSTVPTPPPSGSGTAPVSVPTPTVSPGVSPAPLSDPTASPSTGFSVEGGIPDLPSASTPGDENGNGEIVGDDSVNTSNALEIPTSVTERYVMAQANSADNARLNVFETRTNNRGKFFINDVPEGVHVISVSAPGYRKITITEVNPNRLEIPLIPLQDTQNMDIVGSVLSPTEKPVANAFVSSSFPLGEAIGVPATTNSLGEFKLPAVPFGRRSFFAFVQNVEGEIQQTGLLKNIIVNNKSIKKQDLVFKEQTNPLPGPDGTPRPTTEELIENVNKILTEETPAPEASIDVSPYASETEDLETETSPEVEESPLISPPIEPYPTPPTETVEENQEAAAEKKSVNVFDAVKSFFTGEEATESEAVKIAPVISLRSVLDQLTLSGKVTLPEGYTLKAMDVYLTLEAEEKEAHPEEVYLLSKTFPKASTPEQSLLKADSKPSPKPAASADPNAPQSFMIDLPVPGLGHKYHLQFTATHADGGITYHHIYNLDSSSDTLKVEFLPVMGKIEIQGEGDNTIPTTPSMAWEAVPGAEIYHVTLTEGSKANRRVIWEAWTKSTQLDYPFTTRSQRLKEQETYSLSVAAVKGLKPVVNKSNSQTAHPGYKAIWSDLSRVTHVPFEVVE